MTDFCVRILARQGPRGNTATRAITSIPTDVDGIPRVVADLPELAVVQVHLPLLFGVERASADAAEDADLVAGLVDGAVAVDALGDRQGMALLRQLEGGDQPRRGPGAEAVVAGRLGRGELDDPQAVLAVGQVGELADVGDAELHVVEVVDAAAGVEDLVDPGLRRAARCRG